MAHRDVRAANCGMRMPAAESSRGHKGHFKTAKQVVEQEPYAGRNATDGYRP